MSFLCYIVAIETKTNKKYKVLESEMVLGHSELVCLMPNNPSAYFKGNSCS